MKMDTSIKFRQACFLLDERIKLLKKENPRLRFPDNKVEEWKEIIKLEIEKGSSVDVAICSLLYPTVKSTHEPNERVRIYRAISTATKPGESFDAILLDES